MTRNHPTNGFAPRPSSSRVQRKRDQRVQHIVETAAELFGEHGYDAVSVDDVADRLDVTKGSLYYFDSKDDLATTAIETLGNGWLPRLQELSRTITSSATDQLRAPLREHITIAVQHYPAALQLFLVPRSWPTPQARRIKDLRRRHDQVFRTTIEDGMATGEFTITGIDTTLQGMHAAMTQAPLWCTSLSPESQGTASTNSPPPS